MDQHTIVKIILVAIVVADALLGIEAIGDSRPVVTKKFALQNLMFDVVLVAAIISL
jgi:hypothetical protein